MRVRRATLSDLDILAGLFDQYRIFYKQESDVGSAVQYLRQRLVSDEAIVFLAFDNGDQPAGFTLLYPTFSSVRMKRVYVLNDLYVHQEHRRKGVAQHLLKSAVDFGKKNNAYGLHLETEVSNVNAQALYEKEGWLKEEDEYHYNYLL